MALLGEMHYIPSGPESYVQLPRDGGVAYAAQESWVQNETIRVRALAITMVHEPHFRTGQHSVRRRI